MATGFVRTGLRTRSVHAPNDAAINEVLAEIRQLEAMIGAGAVAHATSHHSGGTDALALDSIAGTLTATKLTGTIASARLTGAYTGITEVGTLTSLDVSPGLTTLTDLAVGNITAGGSVKATDLGAYNDPEFDTAPAVGFTGGVARISFSADAIASDTYVGRVSAGVFGGLLGTVIYADKLDGQHGAYYLDLANATGTSPSADFIESAQDAAALLWSGGGQVTYNDATPSLAITALAATLLTGNLDYARLPNAGGTWNAGGGTVNLTGALIASSSVIGLTMTMRPTAIGSNALVCAIGPSGGPFLNSWKWTGVGTVQWFAADGIAVDATLTHTQGSSKLALTGSLRISAELELDGDLNHDGTLVGLYGVAPVARPAAYTQTYATATRTHAARTAATLTDSSAGTPGTTIAALPTLADSPADADALRDDIMTNLYPVLRNWAASFAAEHNALKADADNTAQVLNSDLDDQQLQGLKQ